MHFVVQSIEQASSVTPSWMRGKYGRERLTAAKKVLTSLPGGLNNSQSQAVTATLQRTLTLWQG